LAHELPHVRRYAHYLAADPADGDDLLQTALERAWRHRAQVGDDSGLRRWLFTIVRNASIDEARRRKRQQTSLLGDSYVEPSLPASQEFHVELREVSRRMSELRSEERSVVEMSVFDDVSHGEIARRLGVAVGTVKSRLSRARATLARQQ
jgi:RNA polymerase sigma-70 factor (ECF subfamily)